MKPRLHVPGRPDIEPEVQSRQSYVTAKHHNDAMAEIDRCLRSADAVLAEHQARMQEMQQRLAILIARFEGLVVLMDRAGIFSQADIEHEAKAIVDDWRQASEEARKAAEAPAPETPEAPATDEEAGSVEHPDDGRA